jgi:hypothetical protein
MKAKDFSKKLVLNKKTVDHSYISILSQLED